MAQEASTASKKENARLSRFAAALNLEQDKHKIALVQSSAHRNMEVGNFG